MVREIWFKKSGSRKVVDQKKKVVLYHKSTLFRLEKSGWPGKKIRVCRTTFLEPDFSNQISKNCKNWGRRIKGWVLNWVLKILRYADFMQIFANFIWILWYMKKPNNTRLCCISRNNILFQKLFWPYYENFFHSPIPFSALSLEIVKVEKNFNNFEA